MCAPTVIAREGGRSSIPETSAIDREAAAYWVPCAGYDSCVWGGPINVIARSEAKQSILSLCGAMDCFAEPVIGRAFARPGGSQ